MLGIACTGVAAASRTGVTAASTLLLQPTKPRVLLGSQPVTHAVGKDIGVSADPEVQLERLHSRSLFMVLASDGVFEFMSNQEVVDMVGPALCSVLTAVPCSRVGCTSLPGINRYRGPAPRSVQQ